MQNRIINEIWANLFGEISGIDLFSFILVANIGFVLSLVVDFIASGENLATFKFTYWWKDNKNRIVLSLILIPIVVGFIGPIVGVVLDINNTFWAGFGIDKIIQSLKDRRKKQTKWQQNQSEE